VQSSKEEINTNLTNTKTSKTKSHNGQLGQCMHCYFYSKEQSEQQPKRLVDGEDILKSHRYTVLQDTAI
jgi:hypothetical protein